MKSEYNRRIFPNHVRVAPVSAAAQSNPIGAIVANGVGRLANFRKFLEAAQLNSFAGTDVRHNRTLIFSKPPVFCFFNLLRDYPRLTFMRELRQEVSAVQIPAGVNYDSY